MVRFESYEEKRKRQEEQAEHVKTKKEIIRDELFERLRKVRKRLAEEENVPPFVVFSDATPVSYTHLKALSAISRTDQKIAMGMLIDVLRGSHNRNVTERGYDRIKTFVVGRDLRAEEWSEYLTQVLNSGVMDVAFD